eukprot:CAMPEP_0185020924 /NCGR_PEP_ID=MMETSP1103-20130426/3574_1 /TAXON_ID=36769 /ORGANISM="Paraphysomonas bandaiensis, Strain Caron Lab Isolate" /LENGTH=1483 /DNA_ID=CAMNT_0027552127 /DNA_START=20 /DNA_END=4471 /DNA_ORIENTATION=+
MARKINNLIAGSGKEEGSEGVECDETKMNQDDGKEESPQDMSVETLSGMKSDTQEMPTTAYADMEGVQTSDKEKSNDLNTEPKQLSTESVAGTENKSGSKGKELTTLPLPKKDRPQPPPDHTLLSSFKIEDLQYFCTLKNIDYTVLKNKEELVSALAATYPPKPKRTLLLRLKSIEGMFEEYQKELNKYNDAKAKAKKKKQEFDSEANPKPKPIDPDVLQEIDGYFAELLRKLQVTESLRESLSSSYTPMERFQHVQRSLCVLDDHPHFSKEDEEMVTIMDSERSIDSIRLLTCKYRIEHSNEDWLSNFCTSGGISVLVENMDNRLEKEPLEETDAAALHQLLLCLIHIMKEGGIKTAIDTRGAIDAFVMSLRFEYKPLAMEVLNLLSVVCSFGESEAVWQTVMGFRHLARKRNELPYAILANALTTEDAEVQAAIIGLMNAIINHDTDLEQRISTRNDLLAVNIHDVLSGVLSSFREYSGDAQGKAFGRRISTAEQKQHEIPKTIKFQAGMKISYNDITRGIAEDGITEIYPGHGVMAGYCWEAKKSKDGVKHRWYQLVDGVFSWYHVEDREKDINCAPNGSQPMSRVVEILSYSTAENIQALFTHCFVISCSDGTKYNLGVADKITKEKWVVALNASMQAAGKARTAYKLENKETSREDIISAQAEFKKQLDIFKRIETEDKEMIVLACSNSAFNQIVDLSRYVKFELQTVGHDEKLRMMLQELAILPASSDDGIGFLDSTLANIRLLSAKKGTTRKKAAKPKVTMSGIQDPSIRTELEVLKAENEALRKQLQSSQSGGQRKVWRSLLDAAKRQKMEQAKNQGGEESKMPMPAETDGATSVAAPATPVTEESTSKADAKAALSGLFAQRGSPPPAAPTTAGSDNSGRGGAAAAMQAMLAGRGGGSGGRGGGGRGGAGRGVSSGGAGAAMAAMLAGRGVGRGTGPPPSAAVVQTKPAVKSSRDIPPPPPLPGQVGNTSGVAPPLPGQAPAGTSNTGLPSKPKLAPKKKMKGLFWTKLKAAEAAATVWATIEEPVLPFDELENGFSDESSNKSKESSATAVVKKQKPKFISLFDGKRTQNVSIACGRLRMQPQAIAQMIVDLDPAVLTHDIVETLIPLVPTSEETALVRAFDGNVHELDTPGRLFLHLVDIPRLEKRLKLHSAILVWEDNADKVWEDLEILSNAITEFKRPECEESLKHVLSLILAVGNYMNGGTSRGQAHGMKLDALMKLVNIKKTGSKKESLMHFVVQQHGKKYPNDSPFYGQWLSVWQAPKLSLSQMEIDLKNLEAQVTDAKNELVASVEISDDDIRVPLRNMLVDFIGDAEIRVRIIHDTMGEVRKEADDIRKFFGDKAEAQGGDDVNQMFFDLMTRFALLYKKCLTDMEEWREENEKKEKAKKAADEKQRVAQKKAKAVQPAAADTPVETSTGVTPGQVLNAFDQYKKNQAQTTDEMVATFKQRMGNLRKFTQMEEAESEEDEGWVSD